MTRCSETLVGTNLNSVWLEGTLVNDPEDLDGASGCRFRIQSPRPPEPPSVFLVEAGTPALEGCRPRLTRGRAVRVIGRLGQHRWTDPQGRRRATVKIVGELVEAVGAPG